MGAFLFSGQRKSSIGLKKNELTLLTCHLKMINLLA